MNFLRLIGSKKQSEYLGRAPQEPCLLQRADELLTKF
jgi:hypothetical protein